jgi:hypothetical protein
MEIISTYSQNYMNHAWQIPDMKVETAAKSKGKVVPVLN